MRVNIEKRTYMMSMTSAGRAGAPSRGFLDRPTTQVWFESENSSVSQEPTDMMVMVVIGMGPDCNFSNDSSF